MKKVILAAAFAIALGASAFAAPVPNVSEKVMKVFTATFNTASDIQWSQLNGIYEARFSFNDILTRVRYDGEGNMLTTIRYYYQQQLPLNVLTKIKKEYAGLTVHSVTEVTVGDATEYHIALEGEKTWTLVLADNFGGLQEERKLVKA